MLKVEGRAIYRPGMLSLYQALEILAAALYDLGPNIKRQKTLVAWCKEHPGRGGVHKLELAGERAGLTMVEMRRLAGLALASDAPIEDALHEIVFAIDGEEAVDTPGGRVVAKPRKRKRRKPGAGPRRPSADGAKTAPAGSAGAGYPSTGDPSASDPSLEPAVNSSDLSPVPATAAPRSPHPMARPTREVVNEVWENKYYECLAQLMRIAEQLPRKQPFADWDDRREANPGLPQYAHLLYTTRRHGMTPLKLLALAREKVASGEPEPEPIRKEILLVESPLVGEAAIAEALAHPFTTADLRAATLTWPLNECLDAMVDTIPALPEDAPFSMKRGWASLERGREDIPSYPTLISCCDAHGLSHTELLTAAKVARREGRGRRLPPPPRKYS